MDVTFVYESLLFEGDSPPATEVADLVDILSRLEDLGTGFATEFPDFTEVRTSSFLLLFNGGLLFASPLSIMI